MFIGFYIQKKNLELTKFFQFAKLYIQAKKWTHSKVNPSYISIYYLFPSAAIAASVTLKSLSAAANANGI